MLIKRKRIIECNIFRRIKDTHLYSRCIDCKVYNSSYPNHHCCSSIELSIHCDNINKLHYFNCCRWIYVM